MRFQFVIVSVFLLALTACGATTKAEYPKGEYDTTREKYGSVLDNFKDDSDNGNILWSSNKKQAGGTIGVNGYLWHAALDTISFMPLASADSNGGVIITDWYTPAESPAERVKLNIRIKDRTLRADGVTVAVFRQQKHGTDWVDTAASTDTAKQLEEAILNRARELKSQAGDTKKE